MAENNLDGTSAHLSLGNQSLDLFDAFRTYESNKTFVQGLLADCQRVDAMKTMTVLALEGLYRIENEVNSGQFAPEIEESLRLCLLQWVSELESFYNDQISRVPKNPEILESLVTFNNRGVSLPVFQYEQVREVEGPYLPDLYSAFQSPDFCRDFFQWFLTMSQNAQPTTALLALEGLYRIESDVQSGQFAYLLRKWRSEFRVDYTEIFRQVPKILRSLTIFNFFQVPLFIDNYGNKWPFSTFAGQTEVIRIDGDTTICHVTHCAEAENIILEKHIKPSEKNIVAGCWFGFVERTSVYGSKSFQITLNKLGVTGLDQGEIVKYKNEVNVILYADDEGTDFQGLKKPTDNAVKDKFGINAYVSVSIFVPSRFLPDSQEFNEVFQGPFNVLHNTFCVKEKRSYTWKCTETDRYERY